jgi:putative transferase (TIGR04331 family)
MMASGRMWSKWKSRESDCGMSDARGVDVALTGLLAGRGQLPRLACVLGDWCLDLCEPEVEATTVLPYHWCDPIKRHSDYVRLEEFYAVFVDRITSLLNEYHGVHRSARYWEIVLGPWLLSYISVMFDRWETIRSLRHNVPDFQVKDFATSARQPPQSYVEFVEWAGFSHDFNSEVFTSILESQGLVDHIVPLRNRTCDPSGPGSWTDTSEASPQGRMAASSLRSCLKTKARKLLRSAYRTGLLRPQVVFFNSYFPATILRRLQLRLRQIPIREPDFLLGVQPPSEESWRTERRRLTSIALQHAIDAPGSWEAHCWKRVPQFLPITAVESWDNLRRVNGDAPKSTRVVVTANSHWNNEPFKVWVAEGVNRGWRLVIADHGGSFPLRDHLYGWEERISDVFIPSLCTYDKKHARLPLPKYSHYNGTGYRAPSSELASKRSLLLVPYHGSPYAIRADSQPLGSQWRQCADELIALVEALDVGPRSAVTIKALSLPALAAGADVSEYLNSRLSFRAPVVVTDFSKAMETASLIVCTYPQTTFAEAMLTGRPTILVFNPDIHQTHPAGSDLLKRLEACGIAFTDTTSAARHLNEIWEVMDSWWESDPVSSARTAFLEELSVRSSNPVADWARFLTGLTKC